MGPSPPNDLPQRQNTVGPEISWIWDWLEFSFNPEPRQTQARLPLFFSKNLQLALKASVLF
jgi:hypothetical protein